jgi:hypothetical protein
MSAGDASIFEGALCRLPVPDHTSQPLSVSFVISWVDIDREV